jgi:hypothetical protein
MSLFMMYILPEYNFQKGCVKLNSFECDPSSNVTPIM